jgi:hypothetical protein
METVPLQIMKETHELMFWAGFDLIIAQGKQRKLHADNMLAIYSVILYKLDSICLFYRNALLVYLGIQTNKKTTER